MRSWKMDYKDTDIWGFGLDFRSQNVHFMFVEHSAFYGYNTDKESRWFLPFTM